MRPESGAAPLVAAAAENERSSARDESRIVDAARLYGLGRLLALARAVEAGSLLATLARLRGEHIPLDFPPREPVYLILCGPDDMPEAAYPPGRLTEAFPCPCPSCQPPRLRRPDPWRRAPIASRIRTPATAGGACADPWLWPCERACGATASASAASGPSASGSNGDGRGVALVICGCLGVCETGHDAERAACVRALERCTVLLDVGDVNLAVYLFDPGPGPAAGLFRLADRLVDLLHKGLRRYDGIYELAGIPSVVLDRDPSGGQSPVLWSCPEDLWRRHTRGGTCLFRRPAGYTLCFGDPGRDADDSELLDETQAEFSQRAGLRVFAHFGPTGAENAHRVPLFLATRDDGLSGSPAGAVFAFHRGLRRLLRLAESVPAFCRLGVRRFLKSHRVGVLDPRDAVFYLDATD